MARSLDNMDIFDLRGVSVPKMGSMKSPKSSTTKDFGQSVMPMGSPEQNQGDLQAPAPNQSINNDSGDQYVPSYYFPYTPLNITHPERNSVFNNPPKQLHDLIFGADNNRSIAASMPPRKPGEGWWKEATSRNREYKYNPDTHSIGRNIGEFGYNLVTKFFPEIGHLLEGGGSLAWGTLKQLGDLTGATAAMPLSLATGNPKYFNYFSDPLAARDMYALNAINNMAKSMVGHVRNPIDTLTNDPYAIAEDVALVPGILGAGLKASGTAARAARLARLSSGLNNAANIATKIADRASWGVPIKPASKFVTGTTKFLLNQGKRGVKWFKDKNGVKNSFKDPLAWKLANSSTVSQLTDLINRTHPDVDTPVSSPSEYATHLPDNFVSAANDVIKDSKPLQKMEQTRINNAANGIKEVPTTNSDLHNDYFGKGENWVGEEATNKIQKAYADALEKLDSNSPRVELPDEVINLLNNPLFGNEILNNVNKNLGLNGLEPLPEDILTKVTGNTKPRLRVSEGETGKPRVRMVQPESATETNKFIGQRALNAIREEIEKPTPSATTGSRATKAAAQKLFANARTAIDNAAPDLSNLRQKFRTSRLRQSRMNLLSELKNEVFDQSGNVREKFLNKIYQMTGEGKIPEQVMSQLILDSAKKYLPKEDSAFVKKVKDLGSLFTPNELKSVNRSIAKVSDYLRDRTNLNKKLPTDSGEFDYRNIFKIPDIKQIFPNVLDRKVTTGKWAANHVIKNANDFQADRLMKAFSDPEAMNELARTALSLKTGEPIPFKTFSPDSEYAKFIREKLDKKRKKTFTRKVASGVGRLAKGFGENVALPLWKSRYNPYLAIPARSGYEFFRKNLADERINYARTSLGQQQEQQDKKDKWMREFHRQNSANPNESLLQQYMNEIKTRNSKNPNRSLLSEIMAQ